MAALVASLHPGPMAVRYRWPGVPPRPDRQRARTIRRDGRLMAGATLVLPPEISRLVNDALGEDLETAGVLLVGEGTGPHGAVRLLARELHLVPEQSYEK